MIAAHPLPVVTGPSFPILQTEAEACRGSGTQSQACGCPATRVPRRALWKAGWKLDSDPAPSLLCCLLGAPKAGVPFMSGTPVPWVGKRGGKAIHFPLLLCVHWDSQGVTEVQEGDHLFGASMVASVDVWVSPCTCVRRSHPCLPGPPVGPLPPLLPPCSPACFLLLWITLHFLEFYIF